MAHSLVNMRTVVKASTLRSLTGLHEFIPRP